MNEQIERQGHNVEPNPKPLPKHEPQKPIINPNPQKPDEAKPQKKVLYCLAYYPNNYSGVDDTPNGSNPTVNAIHYLLNGIGTQKYINENTNIAEDFAVDMSNKLTGSIGNGYGGYEMRDGKGYSLNFDYIILFHQIIDKL